MKWIVFVLMVAGLGYMFYISRDAIERQLKSQSISPEESAYGTSTGTAEDAPSLEGQIETTLETLQNP